MSLYRLEEQVRQQLRIENFEADDFETKRFIEELSRSQPHALGDDNLDPKPYIRTFEAVAGELERLLESTAREEEAARHDTDELAESHNYNVVDMAANVDAAVADAKLLDERVSDVTRATALLGDRLERLSREHNQITESRQLVAFYLSFLRTGSAPELEKLWTSDETSDRRKCAQYVGRLQALATKIGAMEADAAGAKTGAGAAAPAAGAGAGASSSAKSAAADAAALTRVVDDIDKFAERLETHLVNVFQDAYTAFDLVGMKEIAEILHDFNGGSSVVQAFVNQNDFFMQIDKIEDESALQDETLWKRLSDPRSDYPEFEKLVDALVAEVVEMATNETTVITRIFPRPVQVLTVFMQRVFAQRIQGQVQLYTQEAESRSRLALARVIFVCYEKIGLMAKQLKDQWSKLRLDPDGELAAMLDANTADTFTLLITDNYFLEHEIPLLKEIVRNAFAAFFAAHNEPSRGASQRVSDGLLGRFSSSEDAGAANGAGGGSPRSGTSVNGTTDDAADASDAVPGKRERLDRALRRAGERTGTSALLARFRDSAAATNVPLDERARVQMADLQLVLAAFSEMVGREQVLRPPTAVVSDVIELFNLLMKEVGEPYIYKSLDDAARRADQDARARVNWSFLDAVRRGANAVQLVAAFVKTVLFPMVRQRESAHAEMADSINRFVASAQERAGYVLERAVQTAQARIQAVLRKQKRRDFAPRDGELPDTGAGSGPSAAAQEILQLLTDLEAQAAQSLRGPNLESFLTDVAMALHDEFEAHLRKQTINPAGGQVLAADTEAYEYTVVTEWGLAELADAFATLRAIAKLFTSDDKLLASLARESHLARLKPETLNDYVALRADWQSKGLNLTFLHRLQFQY